MIKEHLVSASVTNGAECICNPEILLGTKYGLWDFKNEQAPRGALLDLNAAWELFLSRLGFQNVSFDVYEHKQHEVVTDPETGESIVYNEGDTTYTLKDDLGNPTGATFTIKANKGPIEHIEWENGKLILYYTKLRPLEDKDIQSGAPIHYVTDEDGTVIVDLETGLPLIYDYVMIPVIEIFDNDETRLLFPWYSDNNNVTLLRDSIDGRSGHLGSFAITPESEVYYAKETNSDKNIDLISLQSVLNQINTDLGFEPTYTLATDYPDPDDGEYHTYRATGSNLSEVLHQGFGDKTNLVGAINEDLVRTRINTRLIADKIVESNLDWQNLLEFADSIKNLAFRNSTVPNILAALNWIQEAEIGPFKEDINPEIKKEILDDEDNPLNVTVDNITEALNVIFEEAEENRDRIGYDRSTGEWIELTTDKDETLTEAINEIDEHTDALSDIIQVKENKNPVSKKTYYSNPDLHTLIKNRLRFGQVNKDDITIVEAINDLQDLIGNLNDNSSSIVKLTTDNKNTVVEAINEVDLHADNNAAVLGATYSLDVEGKKSGEITNLETNIKTTIVDAINELDSRIGELDNLNTEDQTNIVNSINEVIKEQPFVYENVNDPESGVVLKDQSNDLSKTNHAGVNSLAVGTNNDIAGYSFSSGAKNVGQGNYNNINGYNNTSKKQCNTVSGKLNYNDGNYNLVNGLSNSVTGSNNLVSGSNNNVITLNSTILGDTISAKNSDNLVAIGESLIFKDNAEDSIAIGTNSKVNGNKAVTLGTNNIVSKESVTIGHNNETDGPGNVAIGDNNDIGCDNSYAFGNINIIRGDHTYSIGENNSVEGNYNFLLGRDQTVEGNNNVVIGASDTIRTNNAINIGKINNPQSNATNIAKDIYIQTHDTESKLQSLIFVDLNDWCKLNNAASLNGEKFLDSTHLVNAIKVYKSRNYSDSALLRFTMMGGEEGTGENGIVFIQGKSTRIYLNGVWYYSDNIENGWSRRDGEYLKIVPKVEVTLLGNTITKHYLVLMDLNTTETIVDTVGAQRSNTPDFGSIDLTHAYGAIDIDDFEKALDLTNKLNKKVDKTAQIITKYHRSDGSIEDKSQNFVNPDSTNISNNIVLDLKESFGFDEENFQARIERGEPNGYVPLNAGGLIDAQYLPSFVDDVIEVWAEYQVESPSGAIIDIHLYNLETLVVPTTGQEIFVKGAEILQGEPGKIYIESNPSSLRRFATQFRWSGHQFTAIGFTNITIGEVEGTAYDGGRGKQLRDDFDDHKNSGTTQIPVENIDGTTTWVTYKPNPHNVTALQLDVVINDPNDSRNVNLEDPYLVDYNVDSALKELFRRINETEDSLGSVLNILGNPEDYELLDNLDNITGNDAPTLVSVVLSNMTEAISISDIDELVENNFDLERP